jgi:hypothetical protein
LMSCERVSSCGMVSGVKGILGAGLTETGDILEMNLVCV